MNHALIVIRCALVIIITLLTTALPALADTGGGYVADTGSGCVADTSSGCVAYYPFTGDARDASGHENHGTVYGASLTADRFDNPEQAYQFGGSTYIEVADDDSLDLEGSLTFAAWVHPRSLDGTTVLQKPDPDHGGSVYSFDYYPGTIRCNLRLAGGGTSGASIAGSTPIVEGVWQHLAVTWDGATLRTYYNGVLDGEQEFTGTIASNDAQLWIGRYYSSCDGDLDEIRIYNRALSVEEIVQIAETWYASWFDTAAHLPGQLGSQWRTDVAARNQGSGDADIELSFHRTDGVVNSLSGITAEPGEQVVLEDVVALLGLDGKGCLQVRSSRPLLLSGRIYNQAAAGTFGQYIEAYPMSETLQSGDTVWLLQLRQLTGAFRTNLSVTNTSMDEATVRIRLYDAAGTQLKQYPLTLAPRELIQDSEPFSRRAGRPDLGWGYAEVTVTAGSGILASASVVDSVTNDATTILMKR